MRFRIACFFLAATLGILPTPLRADAQPSGKVPRIGFLGATFAASYAKPVETLRQGLRELGYVEGQNIHIEYQWAEGKYDRLADLAAELVRLKVNLIVTHGTPGARAAKLATTTIPIVMVGAGDPVGSGLVASLARPGGNVTGLSTISQQLSAKRLELLKETLPKASRVAFLWNPANPHHAADLEETQLAAKALRIALLPIGVKDPNEFESAFVAMTQAHAAALLVMPDPLFRTYRTQIVEFAAKSRLPAAYDERENVAAGGLMAYGVSQTDLYRRTATYVDKILKGAKPADLPVEQPTRFELIINLRTAKALGLTIPPSVLIRADQVIE